MTSDLATFLTSMQGDYARAFDSGTWLFGWLVSDARVGMRLTDKPSEPSLTEVAFVPAEDDGGLTPTAVRAVALGALYAQAREDVAVSRRQVGEFTSPDRVRLDAFLTPRRGVPLRDKDYAGLAQEYAFLVEDGDRSPARTLSAKYGNGSPGQWSNRIGEARRRGLLTPGERGKPSGELTDKAERLLGATDGEE
ncbi:hypothetical protein QWY28_21595 [Nocardioides sp. SOB77]|uniref:GPP34 family phosphoprotein n=1 Tax=Nocardioides oceani TaxID=3058369 RepID=A0ABT8FN05_9ACTN|nr:hypothetical protein [Nocardioides oceani]MDN4175572.1 hypothetical protein [Nocardioides oceani]